MTRKVELPNTEHLKRQAKKIKKQNKISHTEALNFAAVNAGYSNYNHFRNQSKLKNFASKNKSKTPKAIIRVNVINPKIKNPYLNLLVGAINELLEKDLISLKSNNNKRLGSKHIITNLFGYKSVILWQEIEFGELRISVWWKYNHLKHPQSNLTGDAKENFNHPSPMAKRTQYKDFVGVVLSCWLERRNSVHIQGGMNDSIFGRYVRKGEKAELEKLPHQSPNGYNIMGKFYC